MTDRIDSGSDSNHENAGGSDRDTRSADKPRGGDHDHGLHDVSAEVVALQRPVRSVMRVTARMMPRAGMAGSLDDDPNWALPNTAFRIHLETPEGEASRIYTVRAVDTAAGTFDFDIVLHPHASLMMQWAGARRPGDRFRLTGPRPQSPVPDAGGRAVALFLDETAIPALFTLLPTLPPGTHGVGWVATDDEAAFAELPAVPGLQLTRLPAWHAGEAARAPLVKHALALARPQDYVVWGAGERDEMRLIRQHFRTAVGLSKDDVAVAGYWKRGVSNSEIDRHRQQDYQRIIAGGGSLADYDDLAIGI